jgi:hypothetical protein
MRRRWWRTWSRRLNRAAALGRPEARGAVPARRRALHKLDLDKPIHLGCRRLRSSRPQPNACAKAPREKSRSAVDGHRLARGSAGGHRFARGSASGHRFAGGHVQPARPPSRRRQILGRAHPRTPVDGRSRAQRGRIFLPARLRPMRRARPTSPSCSPSTPTKIRIGPIWNSSGWLSTLASAASPLWMWPISASIALADASGSSWRC